MQKESTEQKTEDKKKLVRIEVLAQFVGVTVRRIQQLQQEGIIKPEPVKNKKEGAQYDFFPCVHNILTYYRDKIDHRKSDTSKEMESEKLKQIAIKTKMEELKLKQLEDTLCESEEIVRLIGAALSRLRINLLALPLGVAPLIRNRENVNEIAEIIRERIYRALKEVATIDIKKLKAEEGL